MINLNTYSWNNKLGLFKQESTYSTPPHGRISIVQAHNGIFPYREEKCTRKDVFSSPAFFTLPEAGI